MSTDASDPVPFWVEIQNDGSAIQDIMDDQQGSPRNLSGIWCESAGVIELLDGNGNMLPFSSIPAGTSQPLKPTASTANTTATLYALYR